ncbi:hypothetical protein B0H16DRAFT_556922 [Mycena metata]|uniref:Uncharacterized protein n=1 Tax=Mycena metata TaxID=1033252 RepID=A0AAD7NG71_9AGAR|nr:hypothetical protein B0H16DRAFT_556922 [Mycena metata]
MRRHSSLSGSSWRLRSRWGVIEWLLVVQAQSVEQFRIHEQAKEVNKEVQYARFVLIDADKWDCRDRVNVDVLGFAWTRRAL